MKRGLKTAVCSAVKIKFTMESINDNRTMCGLDWDNPYRIRSCRELINWVNEVGFLPLFKNDVPGFSAEEHVSDLYWWTGDEAQDPYIWREIMARSKEVVFGRFFGGQEGFISLEWLPDFLNFRRHGEGSWKQTGDILKAEDFGKVRKAFEEKDFYEGASLIKASGLQVKDEKQTEDILTCLQMHLEMVVNDFYVECIENADGSIERVVTPSYMRPESIWGDRLEHYTETPQESYSRIFRQVQEWFGYDCNDAVMKVIGRFLY